MRDADTGTITRKIALDTNETPISTWPVPTLKLTNLPLKPSTLSLLLRKGFTSTTDVYSYRYHQQYPSRTPLTLDGGGREGGGGEFNLETAPLPDVDSIIHELETAYRSIRSTSSNTLTDHSTTTDTGSLHGPITASTLLRRPPPTTPSSSTQPTTNRPIVTFARSIDSLLGGGIHPRELTELIGPPGSGRTQLALQLSANARIPRSFGGAEGCTLYIDCEGSFCSQRLETMAEVLVDHIGKSGERRGREVPEWFTVRGVLEGVHVLRVHDETCLVATLLTLDELVVGLREERDQIVRLVVIDSIAFHYRCSTSDYKTRNKCLGMVTASLADLADRYGLAVLMVNQMTTRVGGTCGDGGEYHPPIDSLNGGGVDETACLVPALGDSWAHMATTRILVSHGDSYGRGRGGAEGNDGGQRRLCRLIKSPHKPAGTAWFSITEYGVRDCRWNESMTGGSKGGVSPRKIMDGSGW